jgi:hypothetical protein
MAMSLYAKLPEVVISVEITKTHPFGDRHSAEVGMGRPRRVCTALGEAIYKSPELAEVAFELDGASAAALLVNLGNSFETSWPRDWHPQASPLQ